MAAARLPRFARSHQAGNCLTVEVTMNENKLKAWQKTNARGHLEVRALFRALKHRVQRLDAVVKNAVAARGRRRRLQLELLGAPHLKRCGC